MEQQTLKTIDIRPHWRYYILQMGWLAVLSIILLFMGGLEDMFLPSCWFIASAILACIALYRYIYLQQLVFTLTAEQLIIRRGLLFRTCDYVELYRIIDFAEHRDLLHQCLGLKAVILYSTDRVNPKIFLVGISQFHDVVSIIRDRVIINRTKRNIHEFSNLL